MDADPGDGWVAISRLRAAQLEFAAQTQRYKDVRARLRTTMNQYLNDQPQRERLRHSAFARLQARLETMPVIEQAKGVLMAQNRCGPEEAYDLLRRVPGTGAWPCDPP